MTNRSAPAGSEVFRWLIECYWWRRTTNEFDVWQAALVFVILTSAAARVADYMAPVLTLSPVTRKHGSLARRPTVPGCEGDGRW